MSIPGSLDPLALPELILSITQLLSIKTTRRCRLVCRLWNDTLYSRCWSEVRFLHMDFTKKTNLGTPMCKERWNLIHRLVISMQVHSDSAHLKFEWIDQITCPILTVLNLGLMPRKTMAWNFNPNSRAESARHQGTLQELTMEIEGMTESLLEVLAGCKTLRRLGHQGVSFVLSTPPNCQWIDQYERLWHRIERLTLHESHSAVSFVPFTHEFKTRIESRLCLLKRSSQIHELDYEMYIRWSGDRTHPYLFQIPLSIIRNSPSMRRLNWRTQSRLAPRQMHLVGPMAYLAKDIRDGQLLNCLQELDSLALSWAPFQTEDLVTVLQALPKVTKLDLSWTNSDPTNWKVITEKVLIPRFQTTITELCIHNCCFGGQSAMKIMCSIPGLRVFEADIVDPQDLEEVAGVFPEQSASTSSALSSSSSSCSSSLLPSLPKPQPWVCLGLKKLSLQFKRRNPLATDFKKQSIPTTECILVSQLAKLECLETLNLGPSKPPTLESVPFKETMKLNLEFEKPLEGLKTLRRMKEYTGPSKWNMMSSWGRVEAQWVLDHWPLLERLSLIRLGSMATKMLEEQEIDCSGCFPGQFD
ncbi:hypothetical protein BGZ83_007701 [Gryganskiella cystojenkinii]|nr:hypothetical protein BGZ83_007701 [Gryganskiella cystojenkinii]